MTSKDITGNNEFLAPDSEPAQAIKVIGVGGGGNNAVDHMFKQGIKDVSFVQINTDKQVLRDSGVPTQLVIGPGLGAGGKPEVAMKYAEDSAEDIEVLLDDETKMVFITAGMGGGTGTGAGPVVARIAKEKGILTVGIVTIPFLFEGRQRILKALEGAKEMAKNVDALLMINNERLNDIYGKLHITEAFSKADDTLLYAAKGITEIITCRGLINRDFNDVDATLREGGTAIISSGYGEGENRVTAAIEDALHSPLLRNTDILGSKKLLMVLYIDEDSQTYQFNMDETTQLTDFVDGLSKEVEVMWGLYPVPGLGNKVKITILASGFDVTVDGVDTDRVARPVAKVPERKSDTTDDIKIAKEYGPAAATQKPRILNPDDIDKEESIENVEAPAYRRKFRAAGVRTAPAAKPAPASQNRDGKNGPIVSSIGFDEE